MLELLSKGNFWVMLSLGEKTSKAGPPWDDVIPIARTYIEAAPDRCVWASDWPHPVSVVQPPNDADLLELMYRYAPDEARFGRSWSTTLPNCSASRTEPSGASVRPYFRKALNRMALSGWPPGVTCGDASANAVTSNRTQLTIRARKLFGMPVNASRGKTVPPSLPISGTRSARNRSAFHDQVAT